MKYHDILSKNSRHLWRTLGPNLFRGFPVMYFKDIPFSNNLDFVWQSGVT